LNVEPGKQVQPPELERYLHEHIPLSKAMKVSVVSIAEDDVVLAAPLAPNKNHRDTVFGGSAAALATLAAWSLLHTRLLARGKPCRLVVQRCTMAYEQPISGDFTARAAMDDTPDWQRFLRTLERRGKARIAVPAVLERDGQTVSRFDGEFVAVDAGRDA
jgi:thioesterase domain-containing protein